MKKIILVLTAAVVSLAILLNIARPGVAEKSCEEGVCLYGICDEGRGLQQLADCSKYWGRFKEGKFNGYGIVLAADGKLLEKGLWENGALTDKGECKGNCVNGRGTLSYGDGSEYTGSFKNRMFHGQGRMTWPGGDSFEGKWENDDYADGLFTYEDGSYKGKFKMRAYHGRGVWIVDDQKWEGTWKDGKADGEFNVQYIESGGQTVKIRAWFKNGYIDGKCVLSTDSERIEGVLHPLPPDEEGTVDYEGEVTWTFGDGYKYVGEVRSFQAALGGILGLVPYGEGVMYDASGKVTKKGHFDWMNSEGEN